MPDDEIFDPKKNALHGARLYAATLLSDEIDELRATNARQQEVIDRLVEDVEYYKTQARRFDRLNDALMKGFIPLQECAGCGDADPIYPKPEPPKFCATCWFEPGNA